MATGDITPEQFEQACKNASKVVQQNIGNILINVTNIGSGELQYRVFNDGKTTSGKKMLYKNAPSNYTRLRKDVGLRTDLKDLIFTGNLFYSMNILSTKNNQVVYGFNNSGTAQIAEWQETSDKQVNQPIFDLSPKEIDLMEGQFARDVESIFTSALEDYPNQPRISQRTAKTIKPRIKTKTITNKTKKKLKIKPKKKPTKR